MSSLFQEFGASPIANTPDGRPIFASAQFRAALLRFDESRVLDADSSLPEIIAQVNVNTAAVTGLQTDLTALTARVTATEADLDYLVGAPV